MESLIMKVFNLLIAPMLLILLPLHTALITLLIFIVFNTILKTIININSNAYKWWRIDKWINEEIIEYLIKTITSYAMSILVICLFEIFVLGITTFEVAGIMVSMTRAIVILCSAREMGRITKSLEELTHFNALTRIMMFLPTPVRTFLESAINNNEKDKEA